MTASAGEFGGRDGGRQMGQKRAGKTYLKKNEIFWLDFSTFLQLVFFFNSVKYYTILMRKIYVTEFEVK